MLDLSAIRERIKGTDAFPRDGASVSALNSVIDILVEDMESLLSEVYRLREHERWQPGRWLRVIDPNGELLMETSDEEEARAAVGVGQRLERQWISNCAEWREEP